jgi:cell wall-associated NlpC family hydrolase
VHRGAGKLLLPLAAGLLAAVTVLVALVAAGAGLDAPPSGLPAALSCTPQPTVGTVAAAGVSLGPAQLANAQTIYAVGADLGLPLQGEIVAIATAMQESGLQDLPYGNGASLGLFQQQVGMGWGTAAQIMDPVYAARSFYLRLVQVPDWQSLPVTVAAQSVQRSAFPGAYAQWQPIATSLVTSFAGASVTAAGTSGSCAVLAADSGTGFGSGSGVGIPGGFSLPAGTPAAVVAAIQFAFAQLGTSYFYGGTCTDAHSPDVELHCDCASLVQQAYRAGGIALPRTTFQQVYMGTPVYSLSDLRPGDLLFMAGSDGTPSSPGHVGMYVGDGLVIQAPHTGEDVQLSPLSQWAPGIVAMRRIVAGS